MPYDIVINLVVLADYNTINIRLSMHLGTLPKKDNYPAMLKPSVHLVHTVHDFS